jgi:hypothetical protein
MAMIASNLSLFAMALQTTGSSKLPGTQTTCEHSHFEKHNIGQYHPLTHPQSSWAYCNISRVLKQGHDPGQ